MLLALGSYTAQSMQGFPDGGLTPYERQTLRPLQILIATCFIQGFYFLYLGVMDKAVTAARMSLMIIAAALVVVVPMMIIPSCPDLPICRAAYERILNTRMDHGEGG
ncbi:hypothetical protein MicloDRAFT_00021690 [Microvirga lotononidis]|uniref:Uncharacterized protein n=2 Tax=Microvirga lotononidis TaxID=864069 RepID=I4Z0E5_9HYPH|nr:hypothetical protein MicloDRAFT_00021690 [Microvirga lotononidis]